MLVQLLGFAHPEDLFRGDLLPDIFRRLWYLVASISFRSTEAFVNYLTAPAAMDIRRFGGSTFPAEQLLEEDRT